MIRKKGKHFIFNISENYDLKKVAFPDSSETKC